MMIELYSQDNRLIKLVTDAAAGLCEIEVHREVKRADVMRMTADFIATTSQLSPGVERFAAQFGAMPLVMPEAGYYLAKKAQHDFVSVIGSDYRDVKY